MDNPSSTIRFEKHAGGILEITLNRPDAANAIDLEMARALADLGRKCELDASIRAVVLTGAGSRFFSAGGDVRSFVSAGEKLPELLRELTMHLHAALGSFARMPAPMVTAINGITAGGGLGLAISGDVCIAARSATFKSAYTMIGISPDASTTFWLPRLMGLRRAQEFVFTNVSLDAEKAQQWGLVTEVVDDAKLRARTFALAEQLAKLPQQALASTRRLLLESFQADHAEQMERESTSIIRLAQDGETKAAIAAFGARSKKKEG